MNVLYYIFISFLTIAALPVLFVVSLLVLFTSGFPIFYYQKRVGKYGKPFDLVKFRTMFVGADRKQSTLRFKNEAHGPVFKIHDDPRFTGVGKFLSHTGLDELPQLWNVLRGVMALIGPRPLPVEEAKKLSPSQQKRHAIKPGIISPWIVEGYHRNTFDTWMKSDVVYIQKKSFWYDVVIFFRALRLFSVLLSGEIRDRVKKEL